MITLQNTATFLGVKTMLHSTKHLSYESISRRPKLIFPPSVLSKMKQSQWWNDCDYNIQKIPNQKICTSQQYKSLSAVPLMPFWHRRGLMLDRSWEQLSYQQHVLLRLSSKSAQRKFSMKLQEAEAHCHPLVILNHPQSFQALNTLWMRYGLDLLNCLWLSVHAKKSALLLGVGYSGVRRGYKLLQINHRTSSFPSNTSRDSQFMQPTNKTTVTLHMLNYSSLMISRILMQSDAIQQVTWALMQCLKKCHKFQPLRGTFV